jgi:SPFH domain / Band 7 family/NfeD-like C-terminal, partner-binding
LDRLRSLHCSRHSCPLSYPDARHEPHRDCCASRNEGLVLQRVDGFGGTAKIGGEEWSARSFLAGEAIPAGERVEVAQIDGATAQAIEQLTVTTLRNVIGGTALEKTLTSRDHINTQLRGVLDAATGKWGIRVNRVELKAIDPPSSIQESMDKQMRADREKRATILNAEGVKQSQILEAEGEKASAILRAEGERQSQIVRAEGPGQGDRDRFRRHPRR